jgi:hypothetical protein
MNLGPGMVLCTDLGSTPIRVRRGIFNLRGVKYVENIAGASFSKSFEWRLV